jgi:hypothetical protein
VFLPRTIFDRDVKENAPPAIEGHRYLLWAVRDEGFGRR